MILIILFFLLSCQDKNRNTYYDKLSPSKNPMFLSFCMDISYSINMEMTSNTKGLERQWFFNIRSFKHLCQLELYPVELSNSFMYLYVNDININRKKSLRLA